MSFQPFEFSVVEIYASTVSVPNAGAIDFHVAVRFVADVVLEVFRWDQFAYADSQEGTTAELLYGFDYRTRMAVRPGEAPVFFEFVADVQPGSTPANAPTAGCGWPVTTTWFIPRELKSGVYIVRASALDTVSYALFVVRPLLADIRNKVVCQLSTNTYQAYNPWGGACFYALQGQGENAARCDAVSTVSFERPCQLWDFILYDQPIVSWLDANYGDVDYMANVDLHLHPVAYQLFISCGHDEYWSSEMRDYLDSYLINLDFPGNALILSGNTCYRPIEYQGSSMTKLAENWGPQRPEFLTTGLSWSAANWSGPLSPRGYVVKDAGSWIYKDTGLAAGQTFGELHGIIGYETDAVLSPDYQPHIVAEAYLTEWKDNAPNYLANIVVIPKGAGYLVNVGTTAWGQGLRGLAPSPVVEQITRNCVERMGGLGSLEG
jgi:hypothetical protein